MRDLNEIHTGCVYGRENILDKKFLKWDGGRGAPHRPIFLTCMKPTIKSGAILMKFTTGCVYGRENIVDKKFLKSDGGEGCPSYAYIFDLYEAYP